MAVPVIDRSNSIIAVLSMSGLVSHFNEERYPEFVKALQEKAGELASNWPQRHFRSLIPVSDPSENMGKI